MNNKINRNIAAREKDINKRGKLHSQCAAKNFINYLQSWFRTLASSRGKCDTDEMRSSDTERACDVKINTENGNKIQIVIFCQHFVWHSHRPHSWGEGRFLCQLVGGGEVVMWGLGHRRPGPSMSCQLFSSDREAEVERDSLLPRPRVIPTIQTKKLVISAEHWKL